MKNEVTMTNEEILAKIKSEFMPGFLSERERFVPALERLFEDNGNLTPEQLRELAFALSPGGEHTGGALADYLVCNAQIILPDPVLLGAMIYTNWTGGKVGFQFLPDPATVDPDEYEDNAVLILDALADAGPPSRFMVAEDLDFYNALPNVITIYRGFAGVSDELGASGLCWTTNKECARWFAWRAGDYKKSPPRLIMAKVSKRDVLMAHDFEDEIVARPRSFKAVKFGSGPIQFRTTPINGGG